MTDEQFDKICKKLDRQYTLLTKIAKALRILPITKKEELEFRKVQLDNAKVAEEAYQQVESYVNAGRDTDASMISTIHGFLSEEANVFDNVIGDDI